MFFSNYFNVFLFSFKRDKNVCIGLVCLLISFKSARLTEAMEPKGESNCDIHFTLTRKRKGMHPI